MQNRKNYLSPLNVLAIAFVIATLIIMRIMFFSIIEELETKHALHSSEVIESLIDNRKEYLDLISKDWAFWDSARSFVANKKNTSFIDDNFAGSTLSTLKLDYMGYFDLNRNVRYAVKYYNKTEKEVIANREFNEALLKLNELFDLKTLHDSKIGSFLINGEIYLLRSRFVIRSDDTGPATGILVIGIKMQNRFWKKISEVAKKDIAWSIIKKPVQLESVQILNKDQILYTKFYEACCDQSGLKIQVFTERFIHHTLIRAFNVFSIVFGSILIFFFFLLNYINMKLRSSEVELKGQIDKTEESQRLAKLNKKVMDVSHFAGMAQIARSVIHNVGNTLNGIIISTGHMKKSIGQTKVSTLFKMNDKIQAHKDNLQEFVETEDGKTLMKLLPVIAHDLQANLDSISLELDKIEKNGLFIREVIYTQEQYAKLGDDNFEVADLKEIVNDALELQGQLFQNTDIDKVFVEMPSIYCQRTKLIHVITNLLLNAKRAMDRFAETKNKLVIETEVKSGMAILKITDNGNGINTEDIAKLFNTDFTDRKNHAFGLHSCANSLTEMGGTIEASSEGIGKGSTFHISIPLAQE